MSSPQSVAARRIGKRAPVSGVSSRYGDAVRSIGRLDPSTSSGCWLLLDEADDGVYLFEFMSDLDGSSTGDSFYSGRLADAEATYADDIQGEWIRIGSPLPHCQQDWVWPVRVAGRESGNPRFGELERLTRREWVPFDPKADAVPTVVEAIREAVTQSRRLNRLYTRRPS